MGMILTATPSFRGRRIEAGLLSAGQDFDKNTNPFSVGLGKFVDLDKNDLETDLGLEEYGVEGSLLDLNKLSEKEFKKISSKIKSADKKDFIGKKALSNVEKKCRTWGLRVKESVALKGENIFSNNKVIGRVTSSTWSPFQVCGVAIIHLNNDQFGPSSVIDVKCSDGKIYKGEICSLPMYDEKNEIVRGLIENIPTKPEPWPGIQTK